MWETSALVELLERKGVLTRQRSAGHDPGAAPARAHGYPATAIRDARVRRPSMLKTNLATRPSRSRWTFTRIWSQMGIGNGWGSSISLWRTEVQRANPQPEAGGSEQGSRKSLENLVAVEGIEPPTQNAACRGACIPSREASRADAEGLSWDQVR